MTNQHDYSVLLLTSSVGFYGWGGVVIHLITATLALILLLTPERIVPTKRWSISTPLAFFGTSQILLAIAILSPDPQDTVFQFYAGLIQLLALLIWSIGMLSPLTMRLIKAGYLLGKNKILNQDKESK